MKIRRIAVFAGICVSLTSMTGACIAQERTQSLAEAARRAQEQQKQNAAPKAGMVWTNDNLPTSATISVVGQVPTSLDVQRNTASAGPKAPAAASDRNKATAELAAAQKDLDSAKTDLDLAQREYKLDSDQFYSAPNYAANQQGQSKLDADKNQVTAKQQAVDAAQKKVNELQKQLDQSGDKSKTEAPAPRSQL